MSITKKQFQKTVRDFDKHWPSTVEANLTFARNIRNDAQDFMPHDPKLAEILQREAEAIEKVVEHQREMGAYLRKVLEP